MDERTANSLVLPLVPVGEWMRYDSPLLFSTGLAVSLGK